jgi:U2-associated protein SR140
MDKTKIKLAAFFDQDDEEPAARDIRNEDRRVLNSCQAQPVDGHKLNHFAQGSVRKSKKDREKEDEERKAREEEAKTAQVLAEFMDEFESDSPRKSKAGGGFVRAGAGPTYAAPSSSRSGLAPPRGPAAMIRQEPVSTRICGYATGTDALVGIGASSEGQACHGRILGRDQEVSVHLSVWCLCLIVMQGPSRP